MDSGDIVIIVILSIVMGLILLDFVLSVFVFPHVKETALQQRCSIHKWTYGSDNLLYCLICGMKPGDDKHEEE